MSLRLAVLGHPIAHSLSPVLHTAWIRAAGVDATYEAIDVGPPPDQDARARALLGALDGANLTAPLKGRALAWLDRIEPVARAIGAVNTVVRRDGELRGSNTDLDGFADALVGLGFDARDRAAVVLGAGGAGRAVAAALIRAGARVRVLNRSPDAARDAVRQLAEAGLPGARAAGFDAADEAVAQADLIASCLARDAHPPIDPAIPPIHALCVDVNYGPGTAGWLAALAARGARVADGTSMLIHQGARAFEAFTGFPADPDVGRMSLERAAQRAPAWNRSGRLG